MHENVNSRNLAMPWRARMVIMERDIESLGGLSIGESTPIIVLNALAGNIDDGIGMVFLDGVFGRLANEARQPVAILHLCVNIFHHPNVAIDLAFSGTPKRSAATATSSIAMMQRAT